VRARLAQSDRVIVTLAGAGSLVAIAGAILGLVRP
jgi:hypothetical protein